MIRQVQCDWWTGGCIGTLFFEGNDPLGLALIQDGKITPFQIVDRLPAAVSSNNVNHYDPGCGFKGGYCPGIFIGGFREQYRSYEWQDRENATCPRICHFRRFSLILAQKNVELRLPWRDSGKSFALHRNTKSLT
jgi:hypothetical protein